MAYTGREWISLCCCRCDDKVTRLTSTFSYSLYEHLVYSVYCTVYAHSQLPTANIGIHQHDKESFLCIFWRARLCGYSFAYVAYFVILRDVCLCRLFCNFERCLLMSPILYSNPESCRSKQVRYTNLVTELERIRMSSLRVIVCDIRNNS